MLNRLIFDHPEENMKNQKNLIISLLLAAICVSLSLNYTNAKSHNQNNQIFCNNSSYSVDIRCDNPKLVAGKRLYVVRKVTPKKSDKSKLIQHPDIFFADECTDANFNESGVARVNIPAGEYQFSVLYAKDNKFVALKTGFVKVNSNKEISLKANKKPTKLKLKFGKISLKFKEVCMKVDGYLTFRKRDFWSLDDNSYMTIAKEDLTKDPKKNLKKTLKKSFKIYLSPNQKYSARFVAEGKRKGKRYQAIVWESFSAKKPTIKIKKNHYCVVGFKWAGKTTGYKKITNPEFTFHTPEKDELKIDIKYKKTYLITNRKLCELSYGYHTKSGEYLHFNRKAHLFDKKKATLTWGGPLKAKGYARVVMNWKEDTPRSIIYGAYLYNKSRDVLNTFVPHPDPKSPNQAKRLNDTKLAKVGFKAELIRYDGGQMPSNPSWLTVNWVNNNIKDTDKMDQYFKIKLTYNMHGKKIEETLPISKFVTWKSERFWIEAPLEWEGRAKAYLDKAERVMDLCNPVPVNGNKN